MNEHDRKEVMNLIKIKKTLRILGEERTFYISMRDFKDCKEWRPDGDDN